MTHNQTLRKLQRLRMLVISFKNIKPGECLSQGEAHHWLLSNRKMPEQDILFTVHSPAVGHSESLVTLLGLPTPQYPLLQRHLSLVGLREVVVIPRRQDRRRIAHLGRSLEVRFFSQSDIHSTELEELAAAYWMGLWHAGPLPTVSVAGRKLLTLVLEPTLGDLTALSPSDRMFRLHGAAALRAISSRAQDHALEHVPLAEGLGLINALATVTAEQARYATESSLQMLQLDETAETLAAVQQGDTIEPSRLVCLQRHPTTPSDEAPVPGVHPSDGFYAMWDEILRIEAQVDAEGNREVRGLRGRLVEQDQNVSLAESQAADSMEKLEAKRAEARAANVARTRLRARVLELQEQVDDLKVEVAEASVPARSGSRRSVRRPLASLRSKLSPKTTQ